MNEYRVNNLQTIARHLKINFIIMTLQGDEDERNFSHEHVFISLVVNYLVLDFTFQ